MPHYAKIVTLNIKGFIPNDICTPRSGGIGKTSWNYLNKKTTKSLKTLKNIKKTLDKLKSLIYNKDTKPNKGALL